MTYDYDIKIEKINPPLPDGKSFAAKIVYIYETSNGKDVPVVHNFGEAWGNTEQEAHEKMEKIVSTWINENK